MTEHQTPSPVTLERHGSIAVVTITAPPVNALSRPVRRGLLDAARALAADPSVSAVVLTGGAGRFVAGADLREMDLPPDEPFLPEVVAAIEAIPAPVIALLDGPALGGGFEIALACDLRLASPGARLGLTETRLGLVPGAGGTQRVARLTGVAAAIPLVCEGRIVGAAEARALGLVDEVIEGDLLAAASARAATTPKRRLAALPVPPCDPAAVTEASRRAVARAKGVPAIAEAARLVALAGEVAFAEAVAEERATFLRLRESEEARALRHLFLAEREAARVPGLEGVAARPIARVGVIGAGTMGAGIAVALADAGLDVVLVERDATAAETGGARVAERIRGRVAAGRTSEAEAEARIARVRPTADWSALSTVDLAIEATFEDLDVKRDVFRRLDALLPAGAVLATNTSYLDVAAIAAATTRPGDVVGLHFFSPADVMRLVEVVRAEATAPDTIATALALARRLGKQPIVAGNCDGFVGNRIYAVYRRHAEYLVEDGAAPEEVDAALEQAGFAMGIFAVSDLSGLDIAHAMRRRRDATRDPGERHVAIADRLVETGRLGRKAGAGWYAYEDGRRRLDPAVAALVAEERARKGIAPRRFSAEEIVRRLLAVMANEGAKVLAEGIALRASDIDLAFVHGYGFPRTRGGPMWAADRLGLANVLREVEAAHAAGGVGSEPAPLLVDLVRAGGGFAARRP